MARRLAVLVQVLIVLGFLALRQQALSERTMISLQRASISAAYEAERSALAVYLSSDSSRRRETGEESLRGSLLTQLAACAAASGARLKTIRFRDSPRELPSSVAEVVLRCANTESVLLFIEEVDRRSLARPMIESIEFFSEERDVSIRLDIGAFTSNGAERGT